MNTAELHDGWELSATAGPVPTELTGFAVPAQVPGSVHTDLMRAGLIVDPYRDAGEQEVAWMHHVDWRLRRSLTLVAATAHERVDLVFDGLDTVATVRVGSTELGRTVNMHRSVRYDVRTIADGAHRDLVVDLASATAYAEAEADRLGARPSPYRNSFNFVRKMACSFGWDWGPDLRTAGIWKPVRVERWHVARLARVRPVVGLDADGTGRVTVHVDVELSGLETPRALVVTAQTPGGSAHVRLERGQVQATLTLTVPDAPVWWPVGYGAQPLQNLTVRLADGTDEAAGTDELDSWTRRVGFREVELDTSDDEVGTAFTLKVNGRPVFVKGANWIPDDHFVTRITRERLERRLDQAVESNMNLLRVWGGGIYESDDFYDLADEKGLLVWQDFLLACAAYAEDSPLLEEIEAEARENVARLMPHPSLVVWNGGNENLWGYEDWGWQAELEGRSWGDVYAREILPRVVAEVDPSRPYTDNSPYSPRREPADVHPNDPDHGTHHQWEVWNRIDYTAYRSEIPRFCSEFGFQGPPTWRTLEDNVHAVDGRALGEAEAPTSDPVWLVHQKAEDGNGKLDRGMAPHLGVPSAFVDWHWAAQLNQARAVRHAVEHYRAWWPRTAGAIVWQLNDCWPVTSWAAVDSEERPKPLWYALRRAYEPRLLTFGERHGAWVLSVVNDTDERWAGEVDLRLEAFDGSGRVARPVRVDVDPRGVRTVVVDADLVAPGSRDDHAVVATLDGVTAVQMFVEDVDARLDPAPLDVTVSRVAAGYEVDVVARSLALDVCLLVDRLDGQAAVDDGVVTLPAGARATFTVTTAAELDAGDLASAPVLRSANDLRAVEVVGRQATAAPVVP